jgi:hypothetical protein
MNNQNLFAVKSPSPKSRRYSIDEWHPYGWRVSFDETIQGKRVFHAGLGLTRKHAIQHAIKRYVNLEWAKESRLHGAFSHR